MTPAEKRSVGWWCAVLWFWHETFGSHDWACCGISVRPDGVREVSLRCQCRAEAMVLDPAAGWGRRG